jgi:hypothetical protein
MSDAETRISNINQKIEHMVRLFSSSGTVLSTMPDLVDALRHIRENKLLEKLTNNNLGTTRYRDNLQQLQKLLPAMHVQLTIQKASLRRTHMQMQAVAQWLRAGEATI